MFCPNCGQQQMSPEVRYCSRCGFSLRGVLSVRRKDIVQGALLMFIGLMIIFGFNEFISGAWRAIRDIFHLGGNDYGSDYVWSSDFILRFFSAVFIIWGLSRIVFAFVIERESRRKQKLEAPSPSHPLPLQVSGSSPTALPQSQSIPIVEPGRQRLDTTKLVVPSSASEETTRPLKNK